MARVDFVTPSLAILKFPRDMWVEMPEFADYLRALHHDELYQAYRYGTLGDGIG